MRKRVLLVVSSLDNVFKFQQVLADLGVEAVAGMLSQVKRYFAPGLDYDLVIFETRGPLAGQLSGIVPLVEESGIPLLFIVDEFSVGAVRFPKGLACDFVMHDAGREECSARVCHLLGETWADKRANALLIDDMAIDFAAYQVTVAGKPVDLTYLEYALLAFLVKHPDRTFSRDELLQSVWDMDYRGGFRTVDVHIRRIRSKLGPKLAQHVETVRGVGYHWSTRGS